MTPYQYLKTYRYDNRLVTGRFYPSDPLAIEKGDRVGVVLFHIGGPESAETVSPFLFNLFMDPTLLDLPGGRLIRPWLSRLLSSIRGKTLRQEYEAIGGGSPVTRLSSEQAESLEELLNRRAGPVSGATFHTYVAMRYWHPFGEEAARQMKADGITKVVLLPLFPQYSKTTTGSALAYWWHLEQEGEIPDWPTTRVAEYAAHPKYVQAVSERIDEALQRFSQRHRERVPILFSAHGTPLREMRERGDPYCCLVHTTVDRVMAYRGHDRPFQVAFHGKIGPAEWLTPETPDILKQMANGGDTSVLVVPVALVTEHLETTYALDIDLRDQASRVGITHFEVMPALNCHALFIEALAEATLSFLAFPGRADLTTKANNDLAQPLTLLPLGDHTRFDASAHALRCPQCKHLGRALRWEQDRTVITPSSKRPPADLLQ